VKANPCPPSAGGARARGFTVIELVIAISVAAIVIVSIGAVLSRVARARDIARNQLDAVSRASTALDAIRSDLASVIRDEDLFYTRVMLLDGTGYSTVGPADRDEVLVYNNRLRPMRRDEYQGEGGEYESQYRLDSADGVLWMRRDAVPDQNGEGGGMAIPVVDGVVGVSIEAYDGESWYPDWDSDVMGLPWALRVSVTAVGGDLENPTARMPTVTLRTQIPLDRVVPPPQLEESEDEAGDETDADGDGIPDADAAAAAGGGADGGVDGGAGGGGVPAMGGGGNGLVGTGGGGMIGGGGGGGGGGGDFTSPGGGGGGGGTTIGGGNGNPRPIGTGRGRGGYINRGGAGGLGSGTSRGPRG
jgi:type II secretion system protein J